MFSLIAQIVIAALVIIAAGTFLTRASDRIAELTGLGRLLIGSVLLAGTTSLPELFVDMSSVRKGMPDLAVGDLMGSSLANLLILAIGDLLHRQKNGVFSHHSSAHALSGTMSINMAAITGMGIFLGPALARFELGGLGIGPLAITVSYILGLRLVYYDQQLHAKEGDTSAPPGSKNRALARAVFVVAASSLAILIAAPFLSGSAGALADRTGLGKTFIGSTLVAFTTSLPELVATIAAVRMGAFDLAIGNVFGSNTFNMILLVPLDLLHRGSLLAAVSKAHVLTCLATVLATSVAVMGQMYRIESRRRFVEPDAWAIIGIAVGTLFLLYHSGAG